MELIRHLCCTISLHAHTATRGYQHTTTRFLASLARRSSGRAQQKRRSPQVRRHQRGSTLASISTFHKACEATTPSSGAQRPPEASKDTSSHLPSHPTPSHSCSGGVSPLILPLTLNPTVPSCICSIVAPFCWFLTTGHQNTSNTLQVTACGHHAPHHATGLPSHRSRCLASGLPAS